MGCGEDGLGGEGVGEGDRLGCARGAQWREKEREGRWERAPRWWQVSGEAAVEDAMAAAVAAGEVVVGHFFVAD